MRGYIAFALPPRCRQARSAPSLSIGSFMHITSIRKDAFAMPVHNPAYPRPPYRFINREYFIISYETNIDELRAIVPEPLHPENDLVHYEFIRMPDSSGFGDYTESG